MINQLAYNPFIRFQDLLIVARDQKIKVIDGKVDDRIYVYWSNFGLSFFSSEADRIYKYILDAGGATSEDIFNKVLTPLSRLSSFLSETMAYLETEKGKEVFLLPINEQADFWKTSIYQHILQEYFKISYTV